ncbi:hypothetical protein SCP_0311660 [Sparassis crispa]|uniref:Uncharacterized protein n=1 Tax=Sparassis crispa TaxID=139825 RepID=A0A401GGX6_9APHY|nr:hypothetical protein SCP_0311660 [Sparassis crispa]GBE81437.1 hypothetical protein SCP_0311660 [Sparassis crispa]
MDKANKIPEFRKWLSAVKSIDEEIRENLKDFERIANRNHENNCRINPAQRTLVSW